MGAAKTLVLTLVLLSLAGALVPASTTSETGLPPAGLHVPAPDGRTASDDNLEWEESGGLLKEPKPGTTSCEGLAPLERTCSFSFLPDKAGFWPLVIEADGFLAARVTINATQATRESAFVCDVHGAVGPLHPLGAPDCSAPGYKTFFMKPTLIEVTVDPLPGHPMPAGRWLAGVYFAGDAAFGGQPGGYEPLVPYPV